MTNQSPSLIVAGTAKSETAALKRWPGAKVIGSFRDLALVEFIVTNMPADIVAVDASLSTKGETFSAWANRFKAAFPSVSLVVLDDNLDSDANGSSDQVQLLSPPSVLHSQTVVVWSPKGGVGKTFLATNLACAASISTRGQAGLLDLDLYSGDVAVHLDLTDGPTITELAPVLGDLRPEGLDKYSQRHGPSNLNVICSPRRPELSDLVTPEHVRHLLKLASRRWGLLFIDTPPDITSDIVGECIDAASKVVIVVTQDVAALKQCKMAVDILRKLGLASETLCGVLNLAAKDSILPQSKIQEFLGIDLIGVVPDDRRLVERSVYEGKPIVLYSRNVVSDAIWQVVSNIAPGLVADGRSGKRPNKKRGGLFW
ncbi:MAG: AAA family ATPase [Bacillota bacterium]|jgi:MinD-like ATPase involved in chromosome partitioning or flagellar assembly